MIHELWYYINKKRLGRETETINDEAMEDLREIEHFQAVLAEFRERGVSRINTETLNDEAINYVRDVEQVQVLFAELRERTLARVASIGEDGHEDEHQRQVARDDILAQYAAAERVWSRSARNLAEHANEPIGTQVHFSFGEAINFHHVQAQLDAAAESGSIREGLHITLSNCLKHLCNGSEFCQAVLDEQTRLFNSHVNSLLAKHKDEVDAMNAKIADLERGRLAEKRSA